MRVGSLCTGYGGLELALEAVYGDTQLVFVSDIDKSANTLLENHHPTVPNIGDLTTVDWYQQDYVDIVCAGYPCQPFSQAGDRKGEQDERAIFEYISRAISILRPRWLLLENVSGHLTLGGTSVIARLTKLGYDCRWGLVRASDAGAPHQRTRLFIWGVHRKARCVAPDPSGEGLQGLRKEHQLGPCVEEEETSWGCYQGAIRRWEAILGRPAPIPAIEWKMNPVFVEWMMGLPEGYVTDIDITHNSKLKMLGNGVVPQQAELAIRMLTQ